MTKETIKHFYDQIFNSYRQLQRLTRTERITSNVKELLIEIYASCNEFLQNAERLELISKVESKEYFAFSNGSKFSRAINSTLYSDDKEPIIAFLNDRSTETSKSQIQKYLYTIAISFCVAIDLLKDGDQKTPGTYFEYFVAFMIGSTVGIEPTTSIPILNFDDEEKKLPTDIIYDLGKNNRKFHVPISIKQNWILETSK